MTELKKLRSVEEQAKRAEIRTAIGMRIVKARMHIGFRTASDAARKLGIASPTYLAHENGTRSARVDAIQYYARSFCVRAEWLLTGEGAMLPSSELPVKDRTSYYASHRSGKGCREIIEGLSPEDRAHFFAHLDGLFQILNKAA